MGYWGNCLLTSPRSVGLHSVNSCGGGVEVCLLSRQGASVSLRPRLLASTSFLISSLCAGALAQTAPSPVPQSPPPPADAATTAPSPTPSTAGEAQPATAPASGQAPAGTGTQLPTIRVTAPKSKPATGKTDAHGKAAGAGAGTQAPNTLRDRRSQRRRRNAAGAAIGEPDDDLGRGAQFPSGGNEHGNPRSGARPRRRPALRLRQGQPILSARLQSRPRHRPGDLLGRRTDQFADQCPRPGLRRPEFSHSRNARRIGSPQGTLFRRRRRFRQCRRPASFPARQRPAEHRLRDSRQLRLRPVPDAGLDRARRRIAALCRRIQDLRWSVGHRRRRPQVQRSSALQPGHGDERVFRNRHGVHQQLELVRSGRAARHHHRTDRSVRRDRPVGRRRHQPVHGVDEVRAIR